LVLLDTERLGDDLAIAKESDDMDWSHDYETLSRLRILTYVVFTKLYYNPRNELPD
jgi:hypothetical protein